MVLILLKLKFVVFVVHLESKDCG